MSAHPTVTVALRPEVELFLCCARVGIDSERAERIRTLLQHDLDWSYVIDNAVSHGTMPLLFHSLNAVGVGALPEPIMESLQMYFNSNARHNLRLTHELVRLLELFDAHGITALPYKGPVLAAALYGSVLLRQFSDLDIMVPKRQRLEARALLLARGYEPWTEMTAAQNEAHEHSEHAYALFHRDRGVEVDLHWSLAQRRFAIALDPARLWERSAPISLPGSRPEKTVRHIPLEDLLLILCVHGAKHRWNRLGWICDIAELIDGGHDLDWGQIIAQAGRTNSERILFLGLLLAHDLLGATLPDEVLRRIEGDPQAQSLVEQIAARYLTAPHYPLGVLEQELLYLKMRGRFTDQLPYVMYALRKILTPNVRDHERQRLPGCLTFLY